jgi:hypothetical protein
MSDALGEVQNLLEAQKSQQKKSAIGMARYAWVGSGLYLFVTTPGVSFFSLRAAIFFLFGTFVAPIIIGSAVFVLQRSIAWISMRAVPGITRAHAVVLTAMGWFLFLVLFVATYLSARLAISL